MSALSLESNVSLSLPRHAGINFHDTVSIPTFGRSLQLPPPTHFPN